MNISDKLKILADAAKYDVSCASSGSTRENKKNGIGNTSYNGICHSWSADGRCISLLKILLTNDCIYDCKYCVNRSSNDLPRTIITPEELVKLTIGFYKRNYIEGLFLSSAIIKSPNHTMEQLLTVVKTLREKENFNGYIHLKAIPGVDMKLIEQVGVYVDRLSVNIELPSSTSLKLLAPQKTKESIVKPMEFIKNNIVKNVDELKIFKKAPLFVPAGQSTQMIVGATPDSDYKIIKLSQSLYNKLNLKRVYYSAYVPVSNHPSLPSLISPPLLREHRLYQADWLLRLYGFQADDLLNENNPNFDEYLDPKSNWALNNYHLFPIEINKADYSMLLKTPGIGLVSAERIVQARRTTTLDFKDLKKLGIVLKRAKYFITCKGKTYDIISDNSYQTRIKLMNNQNEQISFFDFNQLQISSKKIV